MDLQKIWKDIEKYDRKTAIAELERFEWYNVLSDPRKEVMIQLAIMMGHGKIQERTPLMIPLQLQDYQMVAQVMEDSLWYNAAGKKARRLVEMMRTNDFLL